MRLKKGDSVKIVTGKDRGKTGKIIQVLAREQMVVVDGANLMTKNVRARRQNEKGQRVQFAAPMDVSNVQIVCPKCGKITRIGIHTEGEKKTRTCAKCHATID